MIGKPIIFRIPYLEPNFYLASQDIETAPTQDASSILNFNPSQSWIGPLFSPTSITIQISGIYNRLFLRGLNFKQFKIEVERDFDEVVIPIVDIDDFESSFLYHEFPSVKIRSITIDILALQGSHNKIQLNGLFLTTEIGRFEAFVEIKTSIQQYKKEFKYLSRRKSYEPDGIGASRTVEFSYNWLGQKDINLLRAIYQGNCLIWLCGGVDLSKNQDNIICDPDLWGYDALIPVSCSSKKIAVNYSSGLGSDTRGPVSIKIKMEEIAL